MRRFLQLAVLIALLMPMLGADPSTTRMDLIGHKLVCQCGCGQILAECNHVGCPVSPGMLNELRTQIASGGTQRQVLDFFINKYGPIALAAPIRGGFDNTAWIVPIAVTLLCGVGVFVLARRWRSRGALQHDAAALNAIAAPNLDADLQRRIREETEHDSWGPTS